MPDTSDRELLELAARAAGFRIFDICGAWCRCDTDEYWNPLTSDADALRLAVKLRLIVEAGANRTIVFHPGADESVTKPLEWYEHSDPYAATRRCIVRAAAEIGRQMP